MKLKTILITGLLSLSLIACAPAKGGDTPTPTPGPGGDIIDVDYIEDTWTLPEDGKLPLGSGNTLVSTPENINSPISIANLVTHNLSSSMPNNYSYIQGNNKVNNSNASFYNASNGGGFKFSRNWYGFQTCAFDTFKYLEVSFRISAVENSSASKKAPEEPILHIYGYNNEGTPIVQKFIEHGSIDVSTKGKSLELEIHNNKVCYLEFRLNANPYKGDQCYNFGVDQLKLKGHN